MLLGGLRVGIDSKSSTPDKIWRSVSRAERRYDKTSCPNMAMPRLRKVVCNSSRIC